MNILDNLTVTDIDPDQATVYVSDQWGNTYTLVKKEALLSVFGDKYTLVKKEDPLQKMITFLTKVHDSPEQLDKMADANNSHSVNTMQCYVAAVVRYLVHLRDE